MPPQSVVQPNYSSPGQYPTQQHGPGQYPMQHQVSHGQWNRIVRKTHPMYFQAPTPAQPQPYSDLPPPYPGPPAQGYPPQMTGNPGYPPQMTGGYPPAPGYEVQSSEKQPAFNPNMQ